MRFSTSSIFVTLLAVREAAAASCSSSNVEGNPYLVDYDIWADNVYDSTSPIPTLTFDPANAPMCHHVSTADMST